MSAGATIAFFGVAAVIAVVLIAATNLPPPLTAGFAGAGGLVAAWGAARVERR